MTAATIIALALVATGGPDAGASAALDLSVRAAPLPVEPPSPTYALERQSDGSYVWTSDAFRARIKRDGSVKFEDRVVSATTFLPFLPTAKSATDGPSIESTVRDWLSRKRGGNQPAPDAPLAPARPRGPRAPAPRPPEELFRPMSQLRPDPAEACHYPRPCWAVASVLLINVAGRTDFNDFLLRAAEHDPYRLEKAKFLAATRDLRDVLAARARGEAVRSALDALAATIARIEADPKLTREDRVRLLEALRDETDGRTDEGRDARARIQRALDHLGDRLAAPPQ